MWNLWLQELKNRRKGIIGWSIGLALYSFLLVTLYAQLPPELRQVDIGNMSIAQAFGATSISNFEGYVGAKVLSFLPILVAIYAIIGGTSTLVGEEESGTLELMVSWPIPRWQIVLSKALATGVALLGVCLATAVAAVLGFWTIANQIETQTTAVHFFWAFFNISALAIHFACLCLLLGAILPGRRSVYNLVNIWLVLSYLGNNLAPLYDALQKIQPLFPFHYLDVSPLVLVNGIQWQDTLWLVLTAVAFLLLAILAFQRRDITVGAWPWQRAHLPQ